MMMWVVGFRRNCVVVNSHLLNLWRLSKGHWGELGRNAASLIVCMYIFVFLFLYIYMSGEPYTNKYARIWGWRVWGDGGDVGRFGFKVVAWTHCTFAISHGVCWGVVGGLWVALRTEYWVLRGGIGGVSATFAVKTFSLQCHTKPQSGSRFLCTHFYLYLTIVNNIFRIISRIPATKHEWRMSFRNRNMCFSGLALARSNKPNLL